LKVKLFQKISLDSKGYGGRNEKSWEEMGCYFTSDKDEGKIGMGRYVTFATTSRKRGGKHKYK